MEVTDDASLSKLISFVRGGDPTKQDGVFRNQGTFWDSIKHLPLKFFLSDWLEQFHANTYKDYQCGVKKLVELKLFNLDQSLDAFRKQPHERILDQIKRVPDSEWKEATKQARAAIYLSFTGYLQRLTEGKVRKAIPERHGANKTFRKIREKVLSESLVQKEWIMLLEELKKINPRDCLIIKLCLHGGKRISEVLSLETSQIDYQVRQVKFLQSKTRGIVKEIIITYPEDVMDEIRSYVKDRKGIVFTTQYGKKGRIHSTQLNRNLKIAAHKAGIVKKVSPHVFRTTLITYLRGQGFSDSEIMKVTGHASSSMVAMYDKTSQTDNPSKIIKLWG